MELKVQKDENETSLEQCLRKKLEIEQAIQKRFQRSIAVMFSDIAASTSFFEALGDIRGRAMIQQQTDLLKPVIERHGGRIIKDLGDGLLICFDNPLAAVRAAIEAQDTIETANFYTQSQERLRVKMGLHQGLGIVEQNDIYGDVVNTASRLSSIAKESEILASQSLIDAIGSQKDIPIEYAGVRKFKGKTIPIRTYRIVWNQKRISAKTASPEGASHTTDNRSGVLRLKIRLKGGQIMLQAESINESREPFRIDKYYPYYEDAIRDIVQDLDEHLTRVDEHGRSSRENLVHLRQLGEKLYGTLIPLEIKQFMTETQSGSLILEIDQSLIYIPWELLHDGEDFLCLKYAMGKVLPGTAKKPSRCQSFHQQPIQMLVVADPRGSLPAAKNEAAAIQDATKPVREAGGLIVDIRSAEATCEFFKSSFAQYDIFHYAGHSKFDPENPSTSALLLADSDFEVASLLQLTNERSAPLLAFANACQTSPRKNGLSEEELYGFASGFLYSGVSHYIGSTLDLYDRSSAYFAEDFYKYILRGCSVGEALQGARLESISRYGEELLTWSSYSLFGDPEVRYFAERETIPTPPQKLKLRSLHNSIVTLLLVMLIVLGVIVGKSWLAQDGKRNLTNDIFSMIHTNKLSQADQLIGALPGTSPLYYQAMAAVYLFRGDLDEAEKILAEAKNDVPMSDYLTVIQGHLALAKGDLEKSQILYQQSLKSAGLNAWQQAECHYGLGRIFLLQGAIDQAEAELDLALLADPSFLQAHIAKGIVLERLGMKNKALQHFKMATTINTSDHLSAVMYERGLERLKYEQKVGRDKRVDALIAELTNKYRQPIKNKAGEASEWKSKPLYFFITDFENKGQPAPMEGEDAYIEEQVSSEMATSQRLRPVDRALLDQILEELRLSNSELSDPQRILQLGRLLAARILVSGSIVRYKGQLQLFLKAVDIETSRIIATASGTAEISQQPAQMIKDLTHDILQKIINEYPIRGFIVSVREQKAQLNVGENLGVVPGMRMQMVESGLTDVELVVDDVTADCCYAKHFNSTASLKAGMRVQQRQ